MLWSPSEWYKVGGGGGGNDVCVCGCAAVGHQAWPCTVCLKGPVKKYLPIARARNQHIT